MGYAAAPRGDFSNARVREVGYKHRSNPHRAQFYQYSRAFGAANRTPIDEAADLTPARISDPNTEVRYGKGQARHGCRNRRLGGASVQRNL